MTLTPELLHLIEHLQEENIVGLLAPSFPVDFSYPEIIVNLKRIGIDRVVELTYAAKLINIEYQRLLKEYPEKRYICANCPSIVKYIQTKHPELTAYLINVASPMVVMHRFIKQKYGPEWKTLFIGPCFAKKLEAKEYGVDYAITFKELTDIFAYCDTHNLCHKNITYTVTELGIPDFDHFYNDYTKIYPLAWGVADSLHYKGSLQKEEVYVVDGPSNIEAGIQTFLNTPQIRFLDILMCTWWCVWGPGVVSQAPIATRAQKVLDYKQACKKDKIGSKLGKFSYAKWLDITRI